MNEPNQRRDSSGNKKIVIVMCIYLIVSFSNSSMKNKDTNEALVKKIQDQNTLIPMSTVLSEIGNQQFEGEWVQTPKTDSPRMPKQRGKFTISVTRHSEFEGQRFTLDIKLKKGQYIDEGMVSFYIRQLETNHWVTEHTENKIVARAVANESTTKVFYYEELIFRTLDNGEFNLTNIEIALVVDNKDLEKVILLETQNESIHLTLKQARKNTGGPILFALILILTSLCSFSACLTIIKQFISGEENPRNYSYVTMVMAMMWDAALCLTSFAEAFQNQENIILFIVPSFLLCLLFTNLQLRIIVLIFQSISGQNDLRQVICRFNIASYGGIIAMYPLIFLTNLGTPLFIGFSLLFLPQIYTNAIAGKRPNPNSVYYNDFLLYRFILVLYLKCFPYNLFELKPNYVLGFGCMLIVGCQFGLLWVQKIYGPKKVLPQFLLPPVYKYGYELTAEEKTTQQCAICLESLAKQPESHPDDIQLDHQVMKTPCEHKYHSCCLVQWMKLKMECPQCRAKLPAFQ